MFFTLNHISTVEGGTGFGLTAADVFVGRVTAGDRPPEGKRSRMGAMLAQLSPA